ncbi:hypothetical protein BCON_0058g00240 [Botryotinia convoluta]|uniref:Uncharacterized protein n=1 Tax=Botryotinia convoluta TaxID=54673 RepID=A0A4Z1I976_9HELO|nr:hypothetical protein BCON_0058g00240 [Botryotinia convoluta]
MILASPALSLIFHEGPNYHHAAFVTWIKVDFAYIEKPFMVEHLWEIPGGFALVQDSMFLTPSKDMTHSRQLETQKNHRIITLLDSQLQEYGRCCMKCEMVLHINNVLMHGHKILEAEISACNDEEKHLMSNSKPAKELCVAAISHTGVEKHPDWLIDLDDPPILTPALQANRLR